MSHDSFNSSRRSLLKGSFATAAYLSLTGRNALAQSLPCNVGFNFQNYTINDDLSIDVYTNVNLSRLGLKELPLKFNNVIGDFHCDQNKLTSLVDLPNYISGNLFVVK